MKRRDHEQAIAKLTSGARKDDLLIFMSTKKAMLAAVVAKCRELWEGLLTAGSGCGVSRSAAAAAAADDDDGYYFSQGYEFSCSATPVFAPAKGRRRRRLPPCVGGKQAREMLREQAAMISPVPVGAGGRDGRSPPERSPQWWREQEIDGLAEEFINRFYEQLRSQQVAEEERRPECKSRTSSSSPSP